MQFPGELTTEGHISPYTISRELRFAYLRDKNDKMIPSQAQEMNICFVFFKSQVEVTTVENRCHASNGQLIKIPSQFNKVVSGPWGDNLRSVSTVTGAEVRPGAGDMLYVTGDKKKVKHAEFLLRRRVVSCIVQTLNIFWRKYIP